MKIENEWIRTWPRSVLFFFLILPPIINSVGIKYFLLFLKHDSKVDKVKHLVGIASVRKVPSKNPPRGVKDWAIKKLESLELETFEQHYSVIDPIAGKFQHLEFIYL